MIIQTWRSARIFSKMKGCEPDRERTVTSRERTDRFYCQYVLQKKKKEKIELWKTGILLKWLDVFDIV